MKKTKIQTVIIILLGLLVTISSCKKKEAEIPTLETGSVTDISGNTYKTVKIGNQWWMAEDLQTTKYQDSSFISLVTSSAPNSTWSSYTTGAFCNNVNSQGAVIGRLYNWYAVTDPRGIAPKGWHIPSDEEWKLLELNLGMSVDAANATGWRGTHEAEKLKVKRGTEGGWADYSTIWTTNESGFNAMPFGCRMFDGTWGNPGLSATAFWWSATEQGEQSNQAWYRYLDYKNANVFRYYGLKTYGFSVRCVKD